MRSEIFAISTFLMVSLINSSCSQLFNNNRPLLSNIPFFNNSLLNNNPPFLANSPFFGGTTNLQCGQKTRTKQVTLRNPTPLNSDQCRYTIEPYSSHVCQLLIKFDNFELQQPQQNSLGQSIECIDYLEVGKFKLCGYNTQQHLYVPFDVANGAKSIELSFNVRQRGSLSSWHLVVTQLECAAVGRRINSPLPFVNTLQELTNILMPAHHDIALLAPAGCDQYYTEQRGIIRSFNTREGMNTHYMPNLDYVICVKSPMGPSMVEYVVKHFSLDVETDLLPPYDSSCRGTISTPGRKEDYLMIPQSYLADQPSIKPTYYCGKAFQQSQVVVAAAPFFMYFKSDGYANEKETGFILDYTVRSVLK